MRNKIYYCKCALKPDEHAVLVNQRQEHMRELRLAQSGAEVETEAHKIADLLTALTITDDGPNPGNQPSKLFTSRDEFQEQCAPNIPQNFNADAVSTAEAIKSFEALFHRTPEPTRREAQAAEPTWREAQAANIIAMVHTMIREADDMLFVPRDYHADNPTEVSSLREKVDKAFEIFSTCKKSLNKIKQDTPEKTAALSKLKALDMKITLIGGTLPEPTTPLLYDASYLTGNPIGKLDTIAQMMILLTVPSQ
ncbi:hypothetical protein B0H15DRAFT_804049 [Mycena belliarum]|uniref:Uncharacterized protein n=1 Tax=Mycena belliarum TaxID=1033014 RepID=A0AAD6TX33_9AGAR|nr:hypothetical protein B0H15DRAFT_804049 [Mycena belliae]